MDAIRKLLRRAVSVVQPGQSGQTYRSESALPVPAAMLPSLVAHADWSTDARKRWMPLAIRADDRYKARPPEPVGDTGTLLRRLRSMGGEGPVMVGFDFPIGVPASYARMAGVNDFLAWLPKIGAGEWSHFFDVAQRPGEISMRRPFYPPRSEDKGEFHQRHIRDALGLDPVDDLRRLCERRHSDRLLDASPLFWTLGPQQVGKAAISGWRDMLEPGLRDPELPLVIWPFSGHLSELLKPGSLVVVETYPAEFYHQLKLVNLSGRQKSSKRLQTTRSANAPPLLAWADASGVDLHPALHNDIRDGFGSSPGGEDPFDATVGLFGMLNVLLGRRAFNEPESEELRNIEGWMFGQRATVKT